MTRSLLVLCAVLGAAPASAQLIDGGFETSTPTQMVPDTFGVWGFDRASVTGPAQGVTPFEGALMLRFEGTSPLCAPDSGASGEVGQLVPLPRGIAPSSVCATVSAMFNRVAGPVADTEFRVRVAALDGDPSTYPTGCGSVRPALASVSSSLISDDQTQTWEELTTTLVVPPGATFLAVIVSAQENVVTDDAPAFTGHFADDVLLSFDAGPCNIADIAEPFCLLNFDDVLAFLSFFNAEDPRADLAAPSGVWNFTDVLAFLQAYQEGCPR